MTTRPVRLADGRDWGFVLPTVRLRPAFHEVTDGAGRPATSATLRVEEALLPAVESRLESVRIAADSGAPDALLRPFLGLVVELLLSSHDLDPETAIALLDVESCEFPRLAEEAIAAINNRDWRNE